MRAFPADYKSALVRPRWRVVSTVEVRAGVYLDPEIEANCVVARRGGEQAKMNYRTAG